MIKSITPISGLFELEPLRLSSLNTDLQLDVPQAQRNSPSNLTPATRLPVTVAVGGAESDEFRRQSRDFAETWRNAVRSMEYLETPGENHYTIIEGMTNRTHPLTEALLKQLGL